MSRNDFQVNYDFGVKKYRHLLDIFYKHYCYDGRFVCISAIEKSHLAELLQRELKMDTMIQKSKYVSYSVEEKVVSWPEQDEPYSAFFLETRSCTNEGHQSAGWMDTCEADRLLYAFEIKGVGLLIYFLPFPRLKQWFRDVYLPSLPRPDYGLSVMPDENRTEGRVVEIASVVKAVPTRCFLVTFDEEFRELKPEVDIHRLRESALRGETVIPVEKIHRRR